MSIHSLGNSQKTRHLQDRFIPSRDMNPLQREALLQPLDCYLTPTPYAKVLERLLFSPAPRSSHSSSSLEPDASSEKVLWKIHKNSYQTLEASNLVDEFYTNNLDCDANFVGVNLGTESYVMRQNPRQFLLCSTHGSSLTSLKFKPDLPVLACGDTGSSIILTDILAQRTLVRVASVDTTAINTMSWRNPDELTVGTDRGIYHFDLRAPWNAWALPLTAAKVHSLTWRKGHTYLATGSSDCQVRVFDVRRIENSQNTLHTYGHSDTIKTLEWVKGQQDLLLLSRGGLEDNTFKVVNVSNKQLISQTKSKGKVSSIAFLDHQYFVAGLYEDSLANLQLWRFLPTAPLSLEFLSETRDDQEKGKILGIGEAPDNSGVCCLASDDAIRFWKVDSLKKESLGASNKKSGSSRGISAALR